MTIAEFVKKHPESAEGESETKRYKEYHTKIKYLCQCKNGHLFDYRERVRYSDSDKHHASCEGRCPICNCASISMVSQSLYPIKFNFI